MKIILEIEDTDVASFIEETGFDLHNNVLEFGFYFIESDESITECECDKLEMKDANTNISSHPNS